MVMEVEEVVEVVAAPPRWVPPQHLQLGHRHGHSSLSRPCISRGSSCPSLRTRPVRTWHSRRGPTPHLRFTCW